MAAPVPVTPLPRIIGLTGHAQNGKDTVAGFLADAGYTRVGFADQLKDLAIRVNPIVRPEFDGRLADIVETAGWEMAKTIPEVRRFLQELGDGVRNVIGEDAWIGALAKRVKAYSPYARFVVSDVRYLNEAEWVRRLHGEVWRVTRYSPIVVDANGYPEPYDNGVDPSHPSERDIPAMQVDLDIANEGGLEELARKMRQYILDRALMSAVAR